MFINTQFTSLAALLLLLASSLGAQGAALEKRYPISVTWTTTTTTDTVVVTDYIFVKKTITPSVWHSTSSSVPTTSSGTDTSSAASNTGVSSNTGTGSVTGSAASSTATVTSTNA
ncbi:uncharacterized protein LAESUDRAFT_760841 [Laetiporus sulphureus 93-53]|uniref:Uncharacterized protein n=1 Tax=Laetiporus sulphureus 93-53 TaxID=1314785 RepID=A0A165DG72_9APHY|nr:uncharacterized protein LAESUDRAFT_760841 [Laetiporus sulphureus 93-53]KZT04824.1 hypothetical protein LAESUDRAFT_760841 [Laetiporus sulphureus 93-53]